MLRSAVVAASVHPAGLAEAVPGADSGAREGAGALDALALNTPPRELAPADARELSKLFLVRLRSLEEGTREYQYVRGTLIEMNISLVRYAARRFRNRTAQARGELDDIVQVGTIGLIKAIDRFDPDRGVEFTTLALPFIVGEIKRYFRDTTWAVHVPRRLQELRADIARSQEALSDLLGRAPTVAEIAEDLGIGEEEVVEGMVAANGYASESLDAAVDADAQAGSVRPGRRTLADTLGETDPAMELFEDFATLAPLLARLDERDRRILAMRFGREMTQAEIGAELGISQMQVSRLLSRTLARLREGMLAS
ncbi:SigB/SigF/SigG family RNA polymerase sigma factor [Streptomyces sp. BR123]|uniref:SigB/SigF/SigG family RNA polymerase sigma factor n=1 Tax=Streptomyces sp. BR123 TaxID=2749828 RepID=UPI0015C43E2E|nr:SigB/SigF/SigG family RNA polymerase sigma factor [Streptomyces sp. BR123]NXY99366.1 SigB/SigF/SigG family RNA polymerase sigma factor [Streptomyces sp. BR123]